MSPPKFASIKQRYSCTIRHGELWYYSLLTRLRVSRAARCWSRWLPILGQVDARRRLDGPSRNRRYYLRCRNVVDLIDSALTRPARHTNARLRLDSATAPAHLGLHLCRPGPAGWPVGRWPRGDCSLSTPNCIKPTTDGWYCRLILELTIDGRH